MKHKLISVLTLAILCVLFCFYRATALFLPLFCLTCFLYLSFTILASFQIRFNYFIKSVNRGNNKGLALTFDDGPDPNTTPKILDILREKNCKATFFVIGKNAEKYPELLLTIKQDGHTIANHSYSHSYSLGFFSTEKLITDIDNCSAIIEKITDAKPVFFRPPFGVTNPRYEVALKKLNLISIGWSGRSFDTISKSKLTLLARVKTVIGSGVILLFHDTKEVTVEALPEIINYCRQKGIKIVPLQELM